MGLLLFKQSGCRVQCLADDSVLNSKFDEVESRLSQAPVTHACNPSYSRGSNQEEPAQGR
jgi:hypothetical protein